MTPPLGKRIRRALRVQALLVALPLLRILPLGVGAALGLDRRRAGESDQPAARPPVVEVLGGAARHHPAIRQTGKRYPAQGQVRRIIR